MRGRMCEVGLGTREGENWPGDSDLGVEGGQ